MKSSSLGSVFLKSSSLGCLLAGLLQVSPATAQAADSALAELARCRAIAEPVERLKCYDLIAQPSGSPRAAPTSTASAAASAAASPTAMANTTAPGAGAARPGPPTAEAAAAATARFGLEHVRAADAASELRSSIPGSFGGWDAKTRWRLANGQVWQVADGSRAYYRLESPKVLIMRGALGSFFMEIEGVSHAVPVRRVE